ncbi:MAG: coproporphyrinogen dehydrogenase HemZ [Firmicutes bacterium]|nr:coproporphyrinogen dehydrogenase HemZ [Bacillota bacterium]
MDMADSTGPWGSLKGVRPGKIVQRWMDQGKGPAQIEDELTQVYGMSRDKARLLLEVARRQRPWLLNREQADRLVSIYIGIPFCPSRCLYCSFPGYPLPARGSLVEDFVSALQREIETVGEGLGRRGMTVQTIYMGGGTPTSLNPEQLDRVLGGIVRHLRGPRTFEFTVEAGRPETLTGECLAVLRRAGVGRLTINPQTLNDHTLELIGRRHTAADTFAAFRRAREAGFTCINMDIIIGLPGETRADLDRTLAGVAELNPENLTVHTLALKRASRLKAEQQLWKLPDDGAAAESLAAASGFARGAGYLPYYLYRQRDILGGLENVGYTRPGFEGVYNIQMIEERQTVIGLGAGAGSKWLRPGGWWLVNSYNPKDPINYVSRIDELTRRQVDKLSGLG